MRNAPVLLVDDDPVVLNLHAAVVRSFGFETEIAETAQEGIDAARARTFSFIVSDVQMPGEGGFDFVERLDKLGLKTMPVLFLTGYDDLEIVRGGLRAGGDDFLIKGQPIEVIRGRIAFWMASGFPGLPVSLRRLALKAANKLQGDAFPGVLQALGRSEEVTQSVIAQVQAERAGLGPDYGRRLVERLCIMARVSKLIIEADDGLAHHLRFPDHAFHIIRALDTDWHTSLFSMFAEFETWAADERYDIAGSMPLNHAEDYDWSQPA